MPEVAQERRAVVLNLAGGYCGPSVHAQVSLQSNSVRPRTEENRARRTTVVPVTFNVPMRERVARIVLLIAAHFNLFEAPLW